MKLIKRRMSLEGRFVEAFLYYDYLWLVGEGGDVHAFDIERFVSNRLGEGASVARRLYAHNEELGPRIGVNTRPDAPTDDVRAVLAVPDLDASCAEVEAHSIIFDTRIEANSVLDMRCYQGCAFVATDLGIRQFRVHGRDEMAHMGVGARGNGRLGGGVVHDGKCIQLRASMGAVSAACGRDGGFYARGAISHGKAWRAEFERFAERSHATEFVGPTVANLPSGVDLEFFETELKGVERTPASPSPDSEDEVADVTEIERVTRAPRASELANVAVTGVATAREAVFTHGFLSRRNLFTVDRDRRVQRFQLLAEGKLAVPLAAKAYSPAPGDIIDMTASHLGMVAELDESVQLLSGDSWHSLFDGPVYSVRGYPASKWYRNMLTAVGEDRVELIFTAQHG